VSAPLEVAGVLAQEPLGVEVSIEQLVDEAGELLRPFGG
jgi:hypothetical protein